ncbi:hypothetical protein PVAND_013380 [Polypedilum vanderplanki]|uniref:Uncharacterized protein n=1 Tax=Polypedilum vanderplanki TaxID=319348 RepID=A0A9J6CRD6_POLVA|nr:hypothetical protein PVAND_013380 [Polypedilum vanderplanki]
MMPGKELPDEFSKPLLSPSNSSLSSNSDVILINAHYIRNSRSTSISSCNSTNDDSFETNAANVNLNNNRNRNEDVDEEEDEKYEPIKLPTEPTLEELLRQVTGRGDISTVEQVKLRIISSAISLQRLPYFMPQLRYLNLEGSLLFSLRDLGCDLSSLLYLNISRCGLRSLDGTNGLSTLMELVADNNQIEDAGPCSNLPQIKKISLVNNKIRDFHGMMFLSLCNHLKVLDMSNNVITQKTNYRDTVRVHIPHLAILDQVPYDDVNEEERIELAKLDHQTVRTSSQILQAVNSRIDEMNYMQIQNNDERPSSASSVTPILPVTHISIGKRPTTSDGSKPRYDVSVGEPVCGSIIAKARKSRKLKTAWGDSVSSSSSSFSSSESSTHSFTEGKNKRDVDDSSTVVIEGAQKISREKSRDRSRGRFKNK